MITFKIKSMESFAKSPHLMLLLVLYLLVIVSIFPQLIRAYESVIFWVFVFLVFLFSSAFFAGWFGLVKHVILNESEKKQTEQQPESRKAVFFGSIPVYMFSLMLFSVLLWLISGGLEYVVNRLYPVSQEVIEQLAASISNTSSFHNALQTCPEEIIDTFLKRSLIVYGGIMFYLFLTFYSIPALYFNSSKNPLNALKNGFLALVKKPVETFLLFMFIACSYILIVVLGGLFFRNNIVSFIIFVLRISFVVYAVVLLFSIYEANFADNCNNGNNCLRKDGAGD